MYGHDYVKRYYARKFANAALYRGGDLKDPAKYKRVMHDYTEFRGAEITPALDAQLKVIFDQAIIVGNLATAHHELRRLDSDFNFGEQLETAASHLRSALWSSEDILFEKLKAYTDSLPKPRIIAARVLNDIGHGFYLDGLLEISDPKQPLHRAEREEVYTPGYQKLRPYYAAKL